MTGIKIWRLLFVIILLNCSNSALAQITQLYYKDGHLCSARNSREEPLLNAVRNGNEVLTAKLLQNGGNPNATDDCGNPFISYVASRGCYDLLKIFIKSGANINAVDDFLGEPPLLLLLAFDDKVYNSVKLLIDNGADVNFRGRTSDSALMKAVLNESARLVELLIASGAEVNYQDEENQTAYGYAAGLGNKELKKILFEAGASLIIGVRDYRKKYGENAFFQAAADGRTDVVEAMIAAGTDVNLINLAGKMTALMRATEDSTVDSLLNAGADVNLKDNAGFTALIWAAAFRRESIVIKLIAAGADVNLRNNQGKSALDLINGLNLPSDSLTRAALIKAGAK